MGTRKKNSSEFIPVSEPMLAGNEQEYVRDCLASGWISSAGDYVERFEEDWARYCGVKHGVAVSSGSAALQVAVDALHLGPGDEVILPSFTIVSCILAVLRAGATPVLVDCDPHTYCIDAGQAAQAITPRTRAIMPVHMYGHPCDMDPLLELAQRHGLAIIEDAAEAHGCEYLTRRTSPPQWRRCGGMGTISVFSFYANKLVTTGEGGMVMTNDTQLAERCRSLRNLCFNSDRFRHDDFGYNFRLTNVQAAIGVGQIERMPEILKRKREIGALYDSALGAVKTIRLPSKRDWAGINYWMYTLMLQDDAGMDAREFAERLRNEHVETRPFFMGMHEQSLFAQRGFFKGLRLPVTERIHRFGLYVPSGLTLKNSQIERVSEAVKNILPRA